MLKTTDALPTKVQWKYTLGILGGLGPYAHLSFERTLLGCVEARDDQEYPPWILVSAPQIPSRRLALGGGASPVEAVVRGLTRLRMAGADFGVMACNLIHLWFDEIASLSPIPLINLVKSTLDGLKDIDGEVGLLAPAWTIRCGLYPNAAMREGHKIRFLLPDGKTQTSIDRAIWSVKRGESEEVGRSSFRDALGFYEGCECVLLACTELSRWGKELVGERAIDPVEVGARLALAMMRGEHTLPKDPTREDPLSVAWDVRR